MPDITSAVSTYLAAQDAALDAASDWDKARIAAMRAQKTHIAAQARRRRARAQLMALARMEGGNA
ncbi:hypothetical protein P7L78_26545 [Tistrella bauzanensis]|uniref:hypothetical protein n=1 Tax=Tistrella TaxID=171436 RepID=UPI0031F6301B